MKYMFYPETKIKLHNLTLNIQRKKGNKNKLREKRKGIKKKKSRGKLIS